MDSSNSSDKVTISKIPIHHQKLKSKQLEERLIKKKITDVQFFITDITVLILRFIMQQLILDTFER